MIREFKDGDITGSFVYNVDEVSQHISYRLSLIAGEYRRDTEYGMPWQDLLGQNPVDLLRIETYIKNIVYDTPGVLEIEKFDTIKIGRELIVNMDVNSEAGSFTFEKII